MAISWTNKKRKSSRVERWQAWRRDIFVLCESLGLEPTFQQALVLHMVMDATYGKGKHRLAVKSGQGPGKTTISVVVGLWRTLRFYNSKTIVTAPTMRQCKDVWLAECRKMVEKAPDPLIRDFITVTKSVVYFDGQPDWKISLQTATKAESSQGQHQDNMTVIAEEASGIDNDIIQQYEGTLTNKDSLFLQIGNPNTRECRFFECFHNPRVNKYWRTLTLNGEETPESKWYSHERNEMLADVYGKDSDVYRVRVLGEFPHTDPNCVMSSDDLWKCTDKRLLLKLAGKPRIIGNKTEIAKQISSDFARFGSDESTIGVRQGEALTKLLWFNKMEPADVVKGSFGIQAKKGWANHECMYVPDADGMGQGVMHLYHEAKKRVYEFRATGNAATKDYKGAITRAYFDLAKKVKDTQVYIPPDDRLIKQLSTRQYNITKKGEIILEDKEVYCERGFDSPDRGDTTALAMLDFIAVGGRVASASKQPK